MDFQQKSVDDALQKRLERRRRSATLSPLSLVLLIGACGRLPILHDLICSQGGNRRAGGKEQAARRRKTKG